MIYILASLFFITLFIAIFFIQTSKTEDDDIKKPNDQTKSEIEKDKLNIVSCSTDVQCGNILDSKCIEGKCTDQYYSQV